MRTITLLLLALLPSLAPAQATRPATRPALRIVETLGYFGKPANGIDGLPAAAEVSPSSANTKRDPATGRRIVVDNAAFQAVKKPRFREMLARAPQGGIVWVNFEGDPIAGRLDPNYPPAEIDAAADRMIKVLKAVRDLRPDAEILWDVAPAGRAGAWWKHADLRADDPGDVEATACVARAMARVAGSKYVSGLVVQAYFTRVWDDPIHNLFGLVTRDKVDKDGRPLYYPRRTDNPRQDAGTLEPVVDPRWVDAQANVTGWATATHLRVVSLQQYGKPVSVLFAPGCAYDSLPSLYAQPLSDDDRAQCLYYLRKMGLRNLILYGAIESGTPTYPDFPGGKAPDPNNLEYGSIWTWNESAPWLAAWRSEAAR